jgi:tetratricopeptide (TPR) repeat protein
MAAAETSGDWKKKESFGSAILQIGVVGALLAGGFYFFHTKNQTKKLVQDQLKEAILQSMRNNPADLNKTLAQLDEVLKLDSNSGEALSLAAAIHTDLWLNHKVPGAEAKAKDFLARAEKTDVQSKYRYGARAMHILADGKPSDAEQFVEELRKRGANAAELSYAQAQALKAQGQLSLARTAAVSAMDKAWKDPQYSASFAEMLLDEGLSLQAMDAVAKATAANPEHLRARLDGAIARLLRKDRMKEAAEIAADVLQRPEAEVTPGLKSRALAAKAMVLNVEQKWDDALKAADEGLALNADETWAMLARADALAGKKDAGAPAAYEALITKARTAPVFYFQSAQSLMASGSGQAAMAVLDKYEAVFKDIKIPHADGTTTPMLDRDDRYWLAKGDILQGAGKTDEALAAYDKAIAAKNINLIKAYYAKGKIFAERKDYPKAIEMLENIALPDGTGQLAEAYMVMGDVMFAQKEWGPGCQNFAYGLTRMKATQTASREQLNAILTDVEQRLIKNGQKPIAKVWLEEAKPLIQ